MKLNKFIPGFANSAITGLFGGKKGGSPYEAAAPFINQIPQVAQQNLEPYVEQGQNASAINQPKYQQLVEHPEDAYAAFRAAYKPSEGYQFRRDEMLKAARGASRATGRTGLPVDQAEQARIVNGLLAQDESDYIQTLERLMGLGLTGNENTANRGFQAAGGLTGALTDTLAQQGLMAGQEQQMRNNEQKQMQKLFQQLLGGGLGFALGGPMGGAFGANLGGANMPYPNSQPDYYKQFGLGLNYGF